MIGSVLQRYGFELMQEPERLRNLVEHRCRKLSVPVPAEETWLPVQERWLLGWPVRGSSAFIDRYRILRSNMIRSFGGGALEGWLEQLPAITVMPAPRSEVEIGRGPGRQPNLSEGLVRLGWGGRLLLDDCPQQLPSPLPEGELQILGGCDEPTPLDLGEAQWPQGWLRLENLELAGQLQVCGGLVEMRGCTLQRGSRINVTGPGAILVLEESDIYGQVDSATCTLLEVHHSTFEGASLAVDSAGLMRLQGVAFGQHSQAAVRLKARGRAVLEDCQVRESRVGLRAEGHSQAILIQSWLRDNLQCGLLAEDDSKLEIQGCHFRNNAGDGLTLRGHSRVHLSGCSVQDNGGAGVRVLDQVTLEQASNHLTGNPEGDWLECPS